MSQPRRIAAFAAAALLAWHGAAAAQDLASTIRVAPTRTLTTLMRGGPGSFMYNRGGGNLHAGVDIVANQSTMDRDAYRVMAAGNGRVAYARLNGGEESGYGYTVVVDHGNGVYTQYSHLATNASRGLVKVGDEVHAGDVIGYLADLATGELSSGNVRADVVAQYDRIQLHLEVFQAPAGRTSAGALAPLKAGSTLLDSTGRLRELGYASF